MYGVLWKSSTAIDLIKYLAAAVGSAALGATGAGKLLGLIQIGYSVAQKFIDGKEKDKNNPFWESLAKASEAGA